MTFAMKQDEPANPVCVGLFGGKRIVLGWQPPGDQFEKFGRPIGRNCVFGTDW
jgi:hypothetical protein